MPRTVPSTGILNINSNSLIGVTGRICESDAARDVDADIVSLYEISGSAVTDAYARTINTGN